MKSKTPKRVLSAILLLFAASVIAAAGSYAFAQTSEEDETSANLEKAKNRRYPGGRDEQELTVQSSLPMPTRNADAPRPTPAGSDEESSND